MKPLRLVALPLATAAALHAEAAHAQSTPPVYAPPPQPAMGPPPALPIIGDPPDPTLRLGAMPVPYLDRRGLEPRRSVTADSIQFDQRRLLRSTIASLASLGATAASVAFTAGVTQISTVVACASWCNSSFVIASIATGAVASSFAITGAYVLAANQFSARGSYWSAFGGWWIGASAGALTTAAVLAAQRSPDLPTLFTFVAFMPLIGQVIGFEVGAQPAAQQRRVSATRVVPSLSFASGVAISLSGTL